MIPPLVQAGRATRHHILTTGQTSVMNFKFKAHDLQGGISSLIGEVLA